MARRTTRLTLAAVLAASACAPENAAPAPPPIPAPTATERQFEFGARRVQVKVPAGWEALDQGNQKRFRKGEFEIVLQFLGPATPTPRDPAAPEGAANIDALFDWGLAAVGQAVGRDHRREEKSRRTVTVDGREAVDIETWQRLDHTNPQRIFLVSDDDDLLALHTVGMAFKDSLAAFDSIRDSLHFVSGR